MPSSALDLCLQAYYRAAKGALGLRKYDRCIELCQQGLLIEPGNKELKDIARRATEQKVVQARRDNEEADRQAHVRAPARQLADAVLARGWRIGRPQFTIGGVALMRRLTMTAGYLC
jgi:hypothetical protein